MPIDSMNIPHLRNETPGVQHVIHFNNAGASLQPSPVIDAVTEYLNSEYAIGGYETADKYNSELNEAFYINIARLIGAEEDEIAFAESATAAWDILFYSLKFEEGDRIITVPTEYASNFIAYLQVGKKLGVEILVTPLDENGSPDLSFIEKEANHPNTRLISVTHIPTNRGIVNPAEKIGEIAKASGVPFLLDACQSVGQYPVDVSRIQCDFLTATGRKYLRGPRGTGFLYVNRRRLGEIEPFTLDLHSAEWTSEISYDVLPNARKFEKWECNFSGKYGLSVAAEYALNLGLDSIWSRVQNLASTLRSELENIEGLELLDTGPVQSGLVSFRIHNKDSNQIKAELKKANINVSVAVASGTLLDMHPKSIRNAIRASVHYYNTDDEIERFLYAIRNLR